MAFQIPLWNRALDKETIGSKYLSFPVLQIGVTYLIIQIIRRRRYTGSCRHHIRICLTHVMLMNSLRS